MLRGRSYSESAYFISPEEVKKNKRQHVFNMACSHISAFLLGVLGTLLAITYFYPIY